MTSQSPRIYTYKITFEEVPYFYYGSKKEKVFNEEYWGSPITNKWCWEFYTPKKQILEIFDYSDEGYCEAQQIEKRIIRHLLNDVWCLNENVGGIMSMRILKRAGKQGGTTTKNRGVGLFKLTEDERKEYSSWGGKKGGKVSGKMQYELGIGVHGLSQEQRSEIGKKYGKLGGNKTYELGLGLHALSKEEKSKCGLKSITLQKEKGIGIFARTEEERKKSAQKSKETNQRNGTGIYSIPTERRREIVKNTNSQKWKCLETGHISTPGPLTLYQRKRGIDTSKRVRIE